ncbi:penicillin-binding protein 2 [Aquihabitans sp. G128]|uniref:peptidoglycan D,D-transpeptidase FtsI family protein n=1 Tax=Aquihabitans sp. G128 TaxID=2849779 RepID=UPI001C23316E|nr:penicillin-binding protein 2 [Aquihabitans sp. G128]QXC62275.1 penicillin-binding protein 2 [Aquihabitans sp. G128]
MTERDDFDDLDEFFGPRTTRPAPRTSGRAAGSTGTRRPAAPRGSQGAVARPAPARRTAAASTRRTASARTASARPVRSDRPVRASASARPEHRSLTSRPAPARRRPSAAAAGASALGAIGGLATGRRGAIDHAPRPSRRPLQPLAVPVHPELVRRRTHRRLIGFVLAVVAVAGGLGAKLTDLQITDRERWVAYGAKQREGYRILPAARGGIFDRSGVAFALSVPMPDVVADPQAVEHPKATAEALAPILGIPEATLLAKLSKGNRYQLLAPTVSNAVADRARKLKLPGITFEDQYVRRNPSEGLARGIVGSTFANGTADADGHQGSTGLEKAYEDQLRGTPGKLTFEKGVGGGTIAGSQQKLDPAKPGTSLYLTLDQSLQYSTEQALVDQVEATGAQQAMAVISRPSTGEILSMASVSRGKDGTIAATGDNQPVSTVFEPGSVNKMITLAGALQEGEITPETTFSVPDHLLIADHDFTDHDPHPEEAWSATDILVTSSNIGTIKIARQLGKDKIDQYLRAFGFGQSSGLPSEVAGIMLPVDKWSGTSIGSIPIGQGISVTALQMLSAYNVIANDGVYVAPKLVAATDDGSGKLQTPASARRRVVSADTAAQMTGMLTKVVSDGTGKPAAIQGYEAAGKTGTARIPQKGPHLDPADAYQDAAGRYHYASSFVGFVAGADLSIIVTVQEPSSSIYGSDVAAPVFSQLASLALRKEQIPPPALVQASRAAVPELSASAREIDAEDPGPERETTQG